MKCIHCEAEWKTKDSETKTIVKCPFCGENPLVKKNETKTCETTKDALAAIYKQFGADILLGKLKAYLPDFAPSLGDNDKNLVYTFQTCGASKALKENLSGSQEDKERAVKFAVRCLTDAYLTQEIAHNIVYEFTDILGWKINKSKKTQESEYKNSAAKQPAAKKTAAKKPAAKQQAVKKPAAIQPAVKKTESKKPAEVIRTLERTAVVKQPDASSVFQTKSGNENIYGLYDKAYSYYEEERYSDAAPLFLKCAEQGHVDAMYWIAHCYFMGNGVTKEYKKSLEWYRKAADKGEETSLSCIGRFYRYGLGGVQQDYAIAAQWFRRAAEKGNKIAQESLDELKKEGKI